MSFGQGKDRGKLIKALSDGDRIEGDLDLSFTSMTTLPNRLTVTGDLDLTYAQIEGLPEGLVVEGNLDLTETNITVLPDDLIVRGNLYLSMKCLGSSSSSAQPERKSSHVQ